MREEEESRRKAAPNQNSETQLDLVNRSSPAVNNNCIASSVTFTQKKKSDLSLKISAANSRIYNNTIQQMIQSLDELCQKGVPYRRPLDNESAAPPQRHGYYQVLGSRRHCSSHTQYSQMDSETTHRAVTINTAAW